MKFERKHLVLLEGLAGLMALGLLIWGIGWPVPPQVMAPLEWATWFLIGLAFFLDTYLLRGENSSFRKTHAKRLGLLFILAASRFGIEQLLQDWLGQYFSVRDATLTGLVLVQASLVSKPLGRIFRLSRRGFLRTTRPAVLFSGGFGVAIMVGTLFLKMPNMTTGGISWIDALFTSCSAVCVTGLIVVDTEQAFTASGQVLILALIQVGGLGIMTLTYFMSLILGQGLSLGESAKLKDVFSEENVGTMKRFTILVVTTTLSIEAVGALLIQWSWAAEPPRAGREWWDAVFHSVSAFCNAGFSTFSDGLADQAIAKNRMLQIIVMVLIIIGGLGFAVLISLPGLLRRKAAKLASRHLPFPGRSKEVISGKRTPVHTVLALKLTVILLVGGFAILLIAAGDFSADGVWAAAFNSVTSRTAGFNITDIGSYNFAFVVGVCFLMFVGGNPGGTAGGVKTTTWFLALSGSWQTVKGHRSLHFGGRKVPISTVRRHGATVIFSMGWLGLTVFLLALSNSHLGAVDLIFESFSALGTVGLSRGITDQLNGAGKILIIATMFIGRIGILVLFGSLLGEARKRAYELPEGHFPL